MLTRPHSTGHRATGKNAPGKQDGVVLLIALIVLVAMTLAAIGLVRSVDTANIITGNLAFKQATTHSGDTGTEAATLWMELNNNVSLNNDIPASGYFASRAEPAPGQSWEAFWTGTLTDQAVTLAEDAAGNRVSYVIHRLCNQAGPNDTNTNPGVSCSVPLRWVVDKDCITAGCGQTKLVAVNQLYYRITSRIAGPRNTVSYVQAIVSL
jgi:hypothetical protein